MCKIDNNNIFSEQRVIENITALLSIFYRASFSETAAYIAYNFFHYLSNWSKPPNSLGLLAKMLHHYLPTNTFLKRYNNGSTVLEKKFSNSAFIEEKMFALHIHFDVNYINFKSFKYGEIPP